MADSMCRTRASGGVGCLQLDSQPQLVGANAGGLSQPLDDDGDALAGGVLVERAEEVEVGRHLRVRVGVKVRAKGVGEGEGWRVRVNGEGER